MIEIVVWYIPSYQEEFLSDNKNQSLFLDYVIDVLTGKNEDVIITWFPAYKCALIANQNPAYLCGPLKNLFLLVLANGDMRLQNEWSSEATQTVEFSSYNVVPIKPVRETVYKTFMDCLEEEFNVLYDEDRKQNLGRHKKMSPAFIQLVLEGAHSRLNKKDNIAKKSLKGGWSDVLNHTGGEWLLLSAVIEHLATCSQSLYSSLSHSQHQHFVCHLQMNSLLAMKKQLLPKIKDLQLDNSTVTQHINKFKIIMASIARKAASELVGIFPISDVEKLLQDNRKQLDAHVEERFKLNSEKFLDIR